MISFETEQAIHFGGAVQLIEDDGRVKAWAEKHVRSDPDIGWILGNYVEADNPNDNGHIFPYEDLVAARETVIHKPLNMLHHGRYIVGAYVGAEMHDPEKEEAGFPVMEALAAFWRSQFPEEYDLVRRAYAEGACFYSMEAVPESIGCTADGCGMVAKYVGRQSDTYCAHLREGKGQKRLIKPHFNAGALIIPPVRPGWKRADISELSKLMEDNEALAAQIDEEFDHLPPREWEAMMAMVLEAKEFSGPKREKLAKSGKAMSHGGFPIENEADLRNAIKAIGRAKNPAAAKAHIIKRAKALGLTKLLPEAWQ